jgi:hypothetical protein
MKLGGVAALDRAGAADDALDGVLCVLPAQCLLPRPLLFVPFAGLTPSTNAESILELHRRQPTLSFRPAGE